MFFVVYNSEPKETYGHIKKILENHHTIRQAKRVLSLRGLRSRGTNLPKNLITIEGMSKFV